MKFDDVFVQYVGQIGRYQWLIYIMFALAAVPCGLNTIAVLFIGGDRQQYWCDLPNDYNISMDKVRDFLIPKDSDDNTTYSKCDIYDMEPSAILPLLDVANSTSEGRDALLNSTSTKRCSSWQYDRGGEAYSSLLMQFTLTCEKEWLLPLVQSLFMCGWLAGNFVFGNLADRFGRMTVIPLGMLTQTVVGLICPFLPNYYAYIVFRCILGAITGGTYTILFVICMEYCGKLTRPFIAPVFHSGFNSGLVYGAVIAYALKPVNHIHLQIIFGASSALFVLLRWVIPESPRWLVSRRRFKEAKQIIRKVAKRNGRSVPKNLKIEFEEEKSLVVPEDDEDEKEEYHNFMDLFRTANIRRISLASFCLWFSLAFIYYGLIFASGSLGANIYINTVISGASGVVASILSIPLVKFLGRRTTIIISQTIMTVCLLAAIFLIQNPAQETTLIVVAAIGKLFNILAFDVIYLHSSEMFPTCIRSIGVGTGSLWARVGALISPLVAKTAIISPILPLIIFTSSASLSTLCTLLLPETLGRPLPETLEDGEEFARFNLSSLRCWQKKSSEQDVELQRK